MQSTIIGIETRAEGRSVPAVVTPVGVVESQGSEYDMSTCIAEPHVPHISSVLPGMFPRILTELMIKLIEISFHDKKILKFKVPILNTCREINRNHQTFEEKSPNEMIKDSISKEK